MGVKWGAQAVLAHSAKGGRGGPPSPAPTARAATAQCSAVNNAADESNPQRHQGAAFQQHKTLGGQARAAGRCSQGQLGAAAAPRRRHGPAQGPAGRSASAPAAGLCWWPALACKLAARPRSRSSCHPGWRRPHTVPGRRPPRPAWQHPPTPPADWRLHQPANPGTHTPMGRPVPGKPMGLCASQAPGTPWQAHWDVPARARSAQRAQRSSGQARRGQQQPLPAPRPPTRPRRHRRARRTQPLRGRACGVRGAEPAQALRGCSLRTMSSGTPSSSPAFQSNSAGSALPLGRRVAGSRSSSKKVCVIAW